MNVGRRDAPVIKNMSVSPDTSFLLVFSYLCLGLNDLFSPWTSQPPASDVIVWSERSRFSDSIVLTCDCLQKRRMERMLLN